jgi:hypothetical protein
LDLRTIYKLIEYRRAELRTLASIYGFLDQRVLDKSVQLDRIMNVYFRRKRSLEATE